MSWDTLLAGDAAKIFASAAAMPGVETIVLKPFGADEEDWLTFPAPVYRTLPDAIVGELVAPSLKVFIPRSADPAIGAESIDIAGDQVSVASDYGGTATDHEIVAIETQDAGGWMLRLR